MDDVRTGIEFGASCFCVVLFLVGIVSPSEKNDSVKRRTSIDCLIFMSIEVHLDRMLVERKMSLTELSEKVGVSIQNLSILKTGKARAIRFSTLAAICHALDCKPGDILAHCEGESQTSSSKHESEI
jgi:putative transcriptional regulator